MDSTRSPCELLFGAFQGHLVLANGHNPTSGHVFTGRSPPP
ncbi:MAG: hypothetical protein AAGG51_30690 [Cyanobacteria bacterium P01_G01_bin.54]